MCIFLSLYRPNSNEIRVRWRNQNEIDVFFGKISDGDREILRSRYLNDIWFISVEYKCSARKDKVLESLKLAMTNLR